MSVNEPLYNFARAFADRGTKNIIPDSNNEASGLASLINGFPAITQVKPEMGGIPPQRADFNGILYMLSAFCLWAQSGGQYTYKNNLQYNINCMVLYKNVFYVCLKENGPDTTAGVKEPGTDGATWQTLLEFIGSLTMDEVQDAIDTSIGEIPKPKPVSMGAYSTVGTSGVAATDGFVTSTSYDNTSITAYVNGLQVMHTAGRSKYGQGACSISFPVPKRASWSVSGANYVRWLPLSE
jgi:hypothetical protein